MTFNAEMPSPGCRVAVKYAEDARGFSVLKIVLTAPNGASIDNLASMYTDPFPTFAAMAAVITSDFRLGPAFQK